MGSLFGGGGAKTTTQQSTVTPWAGISDYLSQIPQLAQDLYNQGPAQIWSGQYLPDQSQQTKAALQGTTDLSQSGWLQSLLQSAGNAAGGVASGAGQGGGNSWLESLLQGGGQGDIYARGLPQQIGTANTAQGVAQDSLIREATGQNVGQNPYLAAAYSKATDPIVNQFNTQIAPGISAQFSAAGRYGRHQGGALDTTQGTAESLLSKTLSDTASGIYGNAYNTDRAAQTGAQQALASMGLGQTGQQINVGSLLAQLQGQGITGASALNQGQSDQARTQLAAAQAMPGIAQGQYVPYQALAGAGQAQDTYNQANQQYLEQYYNYMNGGGALQNLQNYANLIYGNPGAKMTNTNTTQTQSAPSTSTFGNLLSLGAGIGSAVAGFPAFGAGLNSIMGMFGGGGGGGSNVLGMNSGGSGAIWNPSNAIGTSIL